MKVYLIRHGLTDAILDGLYCGTTDVPVNQEGVLLLKQNTEKQLYPAEGSISVFATSALTRTAQTLRAIYGRETEFVISSNFNELGFGEYEMKTDLELRKQSEYRLWVEDYLHLKPPQGEMIDELWRRMVKGFEELNARNVTGGDVLVVSHGISIATVLYYLFGYPLLLSIPQPGEGYAVELGFGSAGNFLPSGAKFLRRISDLDKKAILWKKPNNFSCFTNKTSRLTILHTNDLHGKFLFKAEQDCALHGGISLLSGYIKKARKEDAGVLFTISGDLTEKSLLDKTIKGIDAVDIYNYLAPDVISLGNHELNYGISSLLLFEKCTNFPIINANLHTKYLQQTLLPPYYIKSVNGVRIMFIGIMDEIMFKKMPVSDFEREAIEFKDSLSQIKRICGLYKTPDIDLVILLSHLGLEEDRQLAKVLPKECGVSVILGGHSHVKMERPVIENDILIVQSCSGTGYIGKLDMMFDQQQQSVTELHWELVSIDSENCPFDKEFEVISDQLLDSQCNGRSEVVCTFEQCMFHEKRYESTLLGRLFADAFLGIYAVDIIWFPSKHIRVQSLGPSVTYMNLLQTLPYDGSFVSVELSGAQIADFMRYAFPDKQGEEASIILQFSKGMEVKFDCKSCGVEVRFQGEDLSGQTDMYTVGMPAYIYERFSVYFGEATDDTFFKKRILSTSMLTDLVSWFKNTKSPLVADPTARLVYLNREVIDLDSF